MNLGFTDRELALLAFGIVRALVILLIGLVVARLAHVWILRQGTRGRLAVNLAALLSNLARVGIVAFAVVMVLPTFGVDWTGLLTLIGTVGLAISLSFQDLLKNVIAGIYMLLERPFQIGDTISVGGGTPVTGKVTSIEFRVTTLRTEDGLQVIVPNSTVFGEVVTNRSAFNLQRHQIGVALSGDEIPVSEVTSKIGQALREIPGVAGSPAAATRVENIAPQAVKLQVEFWTSPAAGAEATGAAALALQQALPGADVTVVS